MTAAEKHRELTRILLEGRKLGLGETWQDAVAEALDGFWQQMSEEERAEADAWLAERRKTKEPTP